LREVSEHELDQALRVEERLVFVFFWHERCEPCRELRREDLGEEVCLALSLDAGQHAAAAARHRVLEFPTVVFFKRGAELHRFQGGALPPSTLALLR
jgi:thioredoxin-like negative regulator of GroEL